MFGIYDRETEEAHVFVVGNDRSAETLLPMLSDNVSTDNNPDALNQSLL
jgi:hypothetical protein